MKITSCLERDKIKKILIVITKSCRALQPDSCNYRQRGQIRNSVAWRRLAFRLSEAPVSVSPDGSQWISCCSRLFCCISDFCLSREVEPQEEEVAEIEKKKKGRPTYCRPCPFPVSVHYAALILLRRLPPSHTGNTICFQLSPVSFCHR